MDVSVDDIIYKGRNNNNSICARIIPGTTAVSHLVPGMQYDALPGPTKNKRARKKSP